MGIPRPTIRLFDNGRDVRLIAPSTEEDFTDRMNAYATKRVSALRKTDLDGYILKKGSPSCGMARITVYNERGPRRRDAVGTENRTVRGPDRGSKRSRAGTLAGPYGRYRCGRELLRSSSGSSWTSYRLYAVELLCNFGDAPAARARSVAPIAAAHLVVPIPDERSRVG